MSRYIDADIIPWTDLNDNQNSNIKVLVTFAEKVNRMPTADVRENVKGEWIADELTGWLCSNCGEHIVLNVKMHGNYCPNCGADMKGDNNERKQVGV